MPQHPHPVPLEPPVTHEEIRAASLQFVRKVSGFTRPSAANQAPFDRAVDEVSAAPSGLSRLTWGNTDDSLLFAYGDTQEIAILDLTGSTPVVSRRY